MTVTFQAFPSRILRNEVTSRTGTINEIIKNSAMRVWAKFNGEFAQILIITISGMAAKLPSTTNCRMLTVPRFGAIKMCNRMIENPSERSLVGLKKLRESIKNLRAYLTRNPAHLDQLTALTALWESATKGKKVKFDLDNENRASMFLFLSPLLNRHDSHNIPKALCDWIQELDIIPNDKFIDSAARRAQDFDFNGQESFIVLFRYDYLKENQVASFEQAREFIKMQSLGVVHE